jgi:uncharacterized protein (TIGR03437 family)
LHAICPVRISGQARLVTVANHRLWYPSQVSLLDARRGRVLEEYWHPGAIQALLVYDADRDGHDGLVFAALNNPGDGLRHAALGVLKLPFSKARQTEARRGASLPALTGGGEWAYVLFPLADVSGVAGLLPIPEELSIDQLGRIRVKLPLPEGGAAVYYLNGNLEVAECRFSDNFPAMHERYHRQGLLDRPLSARERTALCQVAPFTVTQAEATPAGNRPVFNAGGVLNGADYTAEIAPGMMVSIFGQNLAPRTATARAIPLPQELEGVSVEVTEPGKTAVRTPLYFVSPGQINLQMPFGITASSVEVRVRTAAGRSDPARVAIVPRAPRLFTRTLGGRGEAIALHVNYRLVGEGDPVEQGGYLILYATGLSEVRPQAIAGNPGGDGGRWGPLNEVTEPVRVTAGGKPATVLFAGLAPGMAGVYQINLQLAPDVPTGRQPVVVKHQAAVLAGQRLGRGRPPEGSRRNRQGSTGSASARGRGRDARPLRHGEGQRGEPASRQGDPRDRSTQSRVFEFWFYSPGYGVRRQGHPRNGARPGHLRRHHPRGHPHHAAWPHRQAQTGSGRLEAAFDQSR